MKFKSITLSVYCYIYKRFNSYSLFSLLSLIWKPLTPLSCLVWASDSAFAFPFCISFSLSPCHLPFYSSPFLIFVPPFFDSKWCFQGKHPDTSCHCHRKGSFFCVSRGILYNMTNVMPNALHRAKYWSMFSLWSTTLLKIFSQQLQVNHSPFCFCEYNSQSMLSIFFADFISPYIF